MFCQNKNYETPYMITVTVRVVYQTKTRKTLFVPVEGTADHIDILKNIA
jgi:hypothetical protein